MSQSQIPRCPCCGYRTGCSTCPVCFWTDDARSEEDAPLIIPDGANGNLSLSEARLNYALYGACNKLYEELVRKPRPDEQP